jgi:hypothetical protein
MGIHKEIWLGEIVRKFTHEGTFLAAVPDYSRYVENDVIHLVDAGAKPEVLINNTTYPIPIQELPDADIAIGLDKFQTKATSITDDELHAISYKKIEHVTTSHRESLQESTADKAAHAFAPAENTGETPVLKTTGDLVDGQRMMIQKDLVNFKRKCDDLKIPARSRNIILSTRHENDLLQVDEKFEKQFINRAEGKVLNYMGFNFYTFINNPKYSIDATTKVASKVAFGAALAGTEVDSSVFFYGPHTFKCIGSLKRYFAEAEKDPQHQRNLINFRQMFIALPKVLRGTGAVISNNE